MRLHRRMTVAFGICLLCVTWGCGADDPLGRRAVSGVVTLDSAPLADGSIGFEPVEGAATSGGAVVSKGKYAISQEQGLPKGKYRVVINAVKPGTGFTLPPGKMPGEEVGTPPVELIPQSWNTKSKNFIEVTEAGDNAFKHEIVTKQK